VGDLESSGQGFNVKRLSPDLVKVEIAGDYDLLRPDGAKLPELVFCHEGLLLADLLQLTEHELLILLQVIDEDCLLVGVTIPVLGLVFLIGVGESLENAPCLANTGSAVDPFVVHGD